MSRGIFRQSLYLLFTVAPSLDDVERALSSVGVGRRTVLTGDGWLGGFPSLTVPYRPEVNGTLIVDTIDRAYPDGMGDPEHDRDCFVCWTMGGFGPEVFPGNLERAVRQGARWFESAESVAERHRALVRLRISYVFGAGPDARVLPEDHDPLDELALLVRCARLLLDLPGALAYFQANGEVLLNREMVEHQIEGAARQGVPPLDLYTQVRLWNVGEVRGWALMDSVGMGQFSVPDIEALFHFKHQDPNEVAGFVRNLRRMLVERSSETITDGSVIDGPGGKWRANREESAIDPPRDVLRVVPQSEPTPPF